MLADCPCVLLDPHRACRDATPPQARRSGPGVAATQEEAVDTDSNACRAGEVERKVWRDNDSLLRGQLLKPLRLEARAVARRSLLALGQLRSKAALTTSSHCVLSCFAQGSSARCNAVSVRRRFT